jgi:hypothetical protein
LAAVGLRGSDLGIALAFELGAAVRVLRVELGL